MRHKVLITGASGFVGYHLVRAAKEAGLEVHAAVRRSSKTGDIVSYVDKFVYPDFSQVSSLATLFSEEQYDYVVHAAAMTKAKREEDMFLVNVSYTLNLVEAAFGASVPVKRVHFVSSLAAIGPISYDLDSINESTICNPVTGYGRSKKTAEFLLRERFSDKPIRVFRPTAVYGPNDKDIFILLKSLHRGLDAYIGRYPQKLSFVYVKDLARVLIESLFVENEEMQCFNITDGHTYGRYELAEIFKKITGKNLWRFHVPYGIVKQIAKLSHLLYRSSAKTPVIYPERLNELTAPNWACDISLARGQLGFMPRYSLEQGLVESLEWYKDNGWL